MIYALVLITFAIQQPHISFEDLLEKSANENKTTLLIFSGSDWCRGCITFKTNVLDKESFKAYSDENLNYYVADFPRDKSTIHPEQLAENKSLADRYNTKGVFPFLVLFDANGTIIRKKSGGFATFEKLKAWVEQ